jgi:phage terminase small subunit
MAHKQKPRLTLKQQLFCDWYLKLGGTRHGSEAAIRAGYSEKTAQVMASENLTKPMVQEYLEKRRHELEDLLGFNKTTIIQDLHQIKERSMQAVPVMYYNPKERKYVQKTEENEDGEEKG